MIPFNRPYLTGRELTYIAEAAASGVLSGNGAFTRRCQERLRERLGAPAVLLTHSCTGALEMAALLSDLLGGRPTRHVDDRDRCRDREGSADHSGDNTGENVVHLTRLLPSHARSGLRGLYQAVLPVPSALDRGQPCGGPGRNRQGHQMRYQHRRPRWDRVPGCRVPAHPVEVEITSADDRFEIVQNPGRNYPGRAVLDRNPSDPEETQAHRRIGGV